MSDPVLVEITRGGVVESFHHGAVAVVDADGKTVLSLGDIDRPIFPRSAVKAFQALPLIESGAADRFQLNDAEIALACASHSGEPRHVGGAASMLSKAGLDLHCLECGAHWPMGEKAARELAAEGKLPLSLHNNCSGKHSGFICVAVQQGIDPKGYIAPDHRLMREITGALGDMTEYDLSKTARGVDGCSIPTYAIPLRNIAKGFAQFASGQGLGTERAKAAARLRKAVAAEPFMVAGSERFDTVVMEALRERAFIKTGAEGVYCGALPELGFGIALKIEDGAGRAAETAMAALLVRFLKLTAERDPVVLARTDHSMKNWNGIEVGRMRAATSLTA